MLSFTSILLCLGVAIGADNGKAVTPPMGWRSWNCYGGNVNQKKMESIMDKMASKSRQVDGKNMSMVDLGYNNCGLDDNWQQCGKGYLKSFHDAQGNPLVRNDTFPSMKAMTDYGHALKINSGWYMNNCICSEHMFKTQEDIKNHMEHSVAAIASLGFDGVKLDGCGQFRNLTWWYQLINATGREILIGNCPYNFYRTSGDIRNNWGSMTKNLHTTIKFQGDPPLSRPGQWAYPDMMEVGRMASYAEDRSHFAAWAITSSPLILGYDLNDEGVTDKIWDIISNQETIAVNQHWEGHPGRLVKQWNPSNVTTVDYVTGIKCGGLNQSSWSYDIANHMVKGPGGKCLDWSTTSQLVLKPCDNKKQQQKFTYSSSDKSLKNMPSSVEEEEYSLKASQQCVDVYNNAGPVVQMFKCNGGGNQKFDFNTDGTLTDNDNPKHCLSSTFINPSGGSGGFMLWAKKQAKGAQAVVVINGLDSSTKPTTATIVFSEIGITSSSATIRDLYNHTDLGTSSKSFTTAAIGSHDSVFLLITPK